MSDILIITPDYASHYLPLSAVAAELMRRGFGVTVATGPGLRSRVQADGFVHAELVLGAGSNPGVIRAEDQEFEESSRLAGFFDSSRRGMIATLMYQARFRLDDLLWQPEWVTEQLHLILCEVRPEIVVVDQLAFGATAALRGLGQQFVSFHPGHPSAMSSEWPYGFPAKIPARLASDLDGLPELRAVCEGVADQFTHRYNDVVRRLDSGAAPVVNAFAATSQLLTLVNYPASMGNGYRLPEATKYIGASIPSSRMLEPIASTLTETRPLVYISLGSFFSARADILGKLIAVFRHQEVDVALATGVTDLGQLPPIPGHWIVAPYLPQPALIARSSLVVSHGGNNTVTETLFAGVPLLVGPLSTDQFSGAADIEAAGVGAAFDPNHDDPQTIAGLARDVLAGEAVAKAEQLGVSLRAHPGPKMATDLIEAVA